MYAPHPSAPGVHSQAPARTRRNGPAGVGVADGVVEPRAPERLHFGEKEGGLCPKLAFRAQAAGLGIHSFIRS